LAFNVWRSAFGVWWGKASGETAPDGFEDDAEYEDDGLAGVGVV
jgi:hypothetical protein